MTDPERLPGTHRRVRNTNRLAVLIASFVGVAVAAILVTVSLDKRGEPVRASGPAGSRSPTVKHSAAGSPTPSAVSPSVSPAASPPTGSPPGSSSTSAVAPSTVAASSPGAGALDTLPAVDVLNDSRITGLAAHAAQEFRSGGWEVATTGNFRGDDVPETTIFYPPDERAAADRFAAQFGVHRVAPASSGLSAGRLTVALARDWADHG